MEPATPSSKAEAAVVGVAEGEVADTEAKYALITKDPATPTSSTAAAEVAAVGEAAVAAANVEAMFSLTTKDPAKPT
jgi:hypothetical protein